MGTRSDIIGRLSDGTWKRIYCHWDGYVSHHGPLLLQHHATQAKVDRLLKPGHMSSLHESSTKPKGHTYEKAVKGHCVYYARDRGDEDEAGTIADGFMGVWPEDDSDMQAFSYVWDGTTWWVSQGDDKRLVLLEDALKDSKGYDIEHPIAGARYTTPGEIDGGVSATHSPAPPEAAAPAKPSAWGQFA